MIGRIYVPVGAQRLMYSHYFIWLSNALDHYNFEAPNINIVTKIVKLFFYPCGRVVKNVVKIYYLFSGSAININ